MSKLTRYKKFKLIVLVTIFVTFMGQIYIKPFNTDFRLTLAVIALNILLIFIDDIPSLTTSLAVGVLMLAVRSVVYSVTESVNIAQALSIYLPVMLFYLFYGLLFDSFKVRNLMYQPFKLFIAFWMCDSMPNIVEFVARQGWRYTNFERGVLLIIIIALVRTIFSVSLILIAQHSLTIYKERQNHLEFVEKVVSTAHLRTELFFLKKSQSDIEEAMRRSYDIYMQIEDEEHKSALLTMTKDIHEIKKDYARVVAGLQRSVSSAPIYDMSIDEIFDIVIDANRNLVLQDAKQIEFVKRCQVTMRTTKFYGLISIINNLVVNSVEAVKQTGQIILLANKHNQALQIAVRDNGHGVDQSEQVIIFTPGYSTKYNQTSGVMSAGVGLTHVKQIVQDIFDGGITVESQPSLGTTFTLTIPLKSFGIKDDNHEL